MKRYFPFIIIGAVAILTVGASTMLYRVKQRAYSTQGTGSTAKLGVNPSHIRGELDAPVTLEVFGDFQCPACATTSEVMRTVEKDYGPRLRVVFWHFPLPAHQHGREAALAVEAASKQGRFWGMHDMLYQNQPAWSNVADVRSIFEKYAESLHLDVPRFEKDLTSAEIATRVDAEQAYGVARGVQNTPTLFINSRLVAPPFNSEHLHQLIDAAQAENKSR